MMRKRDLDTDVVTAARQRIRNIFANGLPVYLSFSGGKDSLVLAHLTEQLVLQGEIDASKLRFEFIDEEAIFPCVERIVTEWRDRASDLGAQFSWYCLEVKHYSCLNLLENDESFICWDSLKKDVWVRTPPPFAIRDHHLLHRREDTYQAFLARLRDGVHMTGVRAAESVQRLQTIAGLAPSGISGAQSSIHPLYDWHDDDVWHYLSEHAVAIPDVYQHLYQIGAPRRNMRISQFFSIDTVPTLARIAEYYPGLMERILLREPSAYLVSLYWDSEMFRRRSPTRRALDQASPGEQIDQHKRMLDMMAHPPEQVLRSKATLNIFTAYQQLVLKFGPFMTQDHCRDVCEALITGDPKSRVKRSIITSISSDATIDAVKQAGQARAPRSARARDQRPGRAARPPDSERL